jgi:hypothetical protein
MTNNIVTAVVDMIAMENPSAATRFTRNFQSKAANEKDEISDLNRYWRTQLAALHASTISARTCLVDDIEPRDWLRHFKNLVLPTIIQHGLPAAS